MKSTKSDLIRHALAFMSVLVVFLGTCLNAEDKTEEFPLYQPSWESLNRHETPDWLLDAKLGLYAHWGIYSVPAFKTEWYGRLMYDKQTRGEAVFDHHIQKYG